MHKLTDEQRARIISTVRRTWVAIAADEIQNGVVDNLDALKRCTDVNLVKQFGEDDEAHELLCKIIAEQGYQAVIEFLDSKLRLA